MRRLALAEHQTARGVRLTRAEREALHGVIPEIVIAPSHGAHYGPARFDLTPGAWVGISQVTSSLVVEIAPKLPVSRLLFLLSYARDPRAWRIGSPVPLEERQDIVETVVALFCAEVRRTLRFGLLHGYRRREESLLTIRGRLRLEEQQRRRFGQSVPAECAYDELTPDIPENRLLKAALQVAARLPAVGGRRSAAVQLLPAFADVTDIPGAGALPTIVPTRLNGRLQPALGLARLILNGAGVEARDGRTSAPSILFDMDRIFEDFVVAALQDALRLSQWSFPQGGRGQSKHLSLDRAGALPLQPDLSWWEDGRCVFVGDVKYKRTRQGEQADLYQLLAYVTAADLAGGTLIYAAGVESDGPAHVHQVRHAGKTLHVAALDLTASPPALLAQIGAVAREVAGQRRTVARRGVA